jgi:DNA repair exonuclease SbcCD ATPase subunit
MKFAKVEISNFLAIEEATLSLSDRGLVVIQGENQDNTSSQSNGAGKSSLPDALCWALFGTTARGASGDEVVNDKAQKNCRVAVLVADGTDCWRIERHRKHKTFKNTLRLLKLDPLTGLETDLTKGKDALTQIEVEKVLGCSYDVFRAAVYAGQEQMPNLPAMTDKQLKMLVEEAAGVTVLEAAYKEANQRLSGAKLSEEKARQELERAETWIEQWTKLLKGHQQSKADFEVQRQAEVKALVVEAQGHVAKVKEIEQKIAAADKPKIEAEMAAIQAAIDNVAAENAGADTHRKACDDADRRKLLALQAHRRAADDLAKALVQLRKVKDIVGTGCGECGKTYCEHDVAARETSLTNDVAQFKLTEQSFRQQCEDAVRTHREAQERLGAYLSSMTDVSAQTAALRALNASLRDVERLEGEKKRWAGLARTKAEDMKAKKAAPNPFEKEVARAEAELRKEELARDDAKARLEAAQEAVRKAEAVSRVFAPAGVRAHILDEVTPYLNDQTAKYLGSLTDGNTTATWTTLVKNGKGELREKFSIEVEDAQGGKSFALLSGGEKRKVRVAASLALQDLVSRRASKPIEFMVADEIDDALDTAGLERLSTILEEKARERGSIFVISHNDLSDWASNVVLVTKRNGRATVQETNS